MANLSNLLESKSKATLVESNLERGEVYIVAGSTVNSDNCLYCWLAPAAGTVQITAWGAGGSSSQMCCCGMGIPGNAGAYFKTTQIPVQAGQFICGCVGQSCGNSSSLCFRGCSTANMFCLQDVGCACVHGGRSGFSICQTGVSMYCCFLACNFCGTQIGSTGCGIICNYSSSFSWIPGACAQQQMCCYIDERACGPISCMIMLHCNPECRRCYRPIIAVPPGYYSTGPSYITYLQDCCCYNSAQNYSAFENALLSMSRTPGTLSNYDYCWSSGNHCHCYEASGCYAMAPPGIGGDGSSPCSSVRDHGRRGGHGAIKIRFIRNE